MTVSFEKVSNWLARKVKRHLQFEIDFFGIYLYIMTLPKDQIPTTPTTQTAHHHGQQLANRGNDHSTSHHHHSRLLYFLTDPSMLSLSRLPFQYVNQPSQPFLFPTTTLLNNTTAPKQKSKSKTNALTTILPLPNPQQSIAVAAVDDCCNQCCPVISAENKLPAITNTTTGRKRPLAEEEKNQPSPKKANIEENEGQTKCKWSSCVASFNTIEDLTPHLYKNHLNNSRKPQSNACFWESCSEGALLDGSSQDLLNHLTSQHLKNALLHACRWINCSERFEAFDTLTIHLSEEHVGSGKSEYTCRWIACERDGKTFTQRQKIMRHIQTHTGAKPFQCQTCQKRFSESNIMTQHMRTHTGEKPFKCDQCDRQFSVSASLTIHKRVHSGEKPFGCKYQDCNKRFSESSNLTKHVSLISSFLYLFINMMIDASSYRRKAI